jgi:hypothetical protein
MTEDKKPPALPNNRVTLAENEETFKVVEEALVDLWKVVDDLWRVRPPKPEFYRVSIFGSSRIRPGTHLYNDVRQLATELASMGCDIVTGGGPGLMQAANEGAQHPLLRPLHRA